MRRTIDCLRSSLAVRPTCKLPSNCEERRQQCSIDMHSFVERKEQAIRMLQPIRRLWTPEDDALLVSLLASGKSWMLIAARLRRTRRPCRLDVQCCGYTTRMHQSRILTA